MGSFYIINTFMKTFSYLIEFLKKQRVTPDTLRAQEKFGSKKTLLDVASGAPEGKQSIPRSKGRRSR